MRLLALHSFRTSGLIFKHQIERTNLGNLLDQAEIIYIDAPNPASGKIPRDVEPFFGDGPYYEWWTVSEMGDQLEFSIDKLERSIFHVQQFLRDEGPFDGIIGFSQGSMLASVIVMLQCRGLILQTVPPLKFCILFAGLKSRYPPHVDLFKMGKVPVPSLHIFGDRDQIREHCVDLANAFCDPVIIQHPRGHSIPVLQKHQIAVVRAFLDSFTHDSVQPFNGNNTGELRRRVDSQLQAGAAVRSSKRRPHASFCPVLPSSPGRHVVKQVGSKQPSSSKLIVCKM